MADFPSTTSAYGRWGLNDVRDAVMGNNWPTPVSPRIFTISPAVSGKTTWNLDVDGPLTLSAYGDWTITTTATFSASIKMWGAGGGQGPTRSNFYTYAGGGGGFAGGTLAFPASSTLIARVGQGGQPTPNGSSGGSGQAFGGGGQAYNYVDGNWNAAGGGGLSGIFLSSVSQANSILIAGAGGGGGSAQNFAGGPCNGGAGGGSTGGTSNSNGGAGGTQSAGGAGAPSGAIGTSVAGSALQGGSLSGTNRMGGGGGGGYFGGGSGIYTNPDTARGAGGGSAYFNPTYVSSATLTAGSGTTPGNSGDGSRGTAGNAGNTGDGGAAQAGADGKIVIT